MFKKLIQPKSVDGVLATFQKTIAQLEGVKAYHSAAKETAEVEIERIQNKAVDAMNEAQKAHNAINKLKSIFG